MPSLRTKQPFRLGRSLAFAISIITAQQASAQAFTIGEVEGSFNSQLSIGASWALEDADKRYISMGNGGTKGDGSGFSSTTDDGKQNFDKGDTFSEIVKGVHDLSLTYHDYGLFLRGKYWYDRVLEKKVMNHGHGPTGYGDSRSRKTLDDTAFDDLAKFSGVALLDAYVHGYFDLGSIPLDLRLGKQVVSWGESTFIRGGVNAINPVDVNAFRRPGAEIKEGLLPVNMIYASLMPTDNLTLESFYQLQWQESVIDGCGTFFSTSDPAAPGCNVLTISGSQLTDEQAFNGGVYVRRGKDNKAKDSGQFGLAARYYAAQLNDTEIGAYFMNIHSRAPLFSTVTGQGPSDIVNSRYFMDYPEDIRIYGLSFSTTVGDTSLAGEISHRSNQPVQLNSTDQLIGALNAGAAGVLAPRMSPGGIIGHDRHKVTQAQLTMIHFVEQVLGAGRLTLVGEVGYSHIDALPDNSKARYRRDPVFGLGEGCAIAGGVNAGNDCTNNGYVTTSSWGYRARAKLNYSNVFAGVNLKPALAFSHDVHGFSATGVFLEGRRAMTVSLNADYLNKYTASLSMTNFWGGKYNNAKDRDFASFSMGVNF